MSQPPDGLPARRRDHVSAEDDELPGVDHAVSGESDDVPDPWDVLSDTGHAVPRADFGMPGGGQRGVPAFGVIDQLSGSEDAVPRAPDRLPGEYRDVVPDHREPVPG